MEGERIDDVRLDSLEVQDSTRTNERDPDVRRDPVNVRPSGPPSYEQPDGE